MDEHLNQHIMTSPFGTADDHKQRIKDLEQQVESLTHVNKTYADTELARVNVFRGQGFEDFIDYINAHLLNNDLVISYEDDDEEGIRLIIEDAQLDRSGNGGQPTIVPASREFEVTGTFEVTWRAVVKATNASDAEDYIYDVLPSDFDRIDASIYDERVSSFEVDDYINDSDVTDVSEA